MAQAGGALTHWIPARGSGIQVIQQLQPQQPDIVTNTVLGLHPDGCCVHNAYHNHIEELRDAQHSQPGYFFGHTPTRLAGHGIAVGADQGL